VPEALGFDGRGVEEALQGDAPKLTEDRDRCGAGVDVRADVPGRNPGVDVGAQVGPEALVPLAKGLGELG
jgi:hypothetical protein